jgi:hypothetical protein
MICNTKTDILDWIDTGCNKFCAVSRIGGDLTLECAVELGGFFSLSLFLKCGPTGETMLARLTR